MKITSNFGLAFLFCAVAFAFILGGCARTDCQNGGTGRIGSCDCPTGYSGDRCEIVDSCKVRGCVNGFCKDQTCDCNDGYEGVRCDERSSDKFVGSYSVVSACDTSVKSVVISQGAFNYQVVISSIQNRAVLCEASGSSLNIPSVKNEGKLNGAGLKTGSTIVLNLNFTPFGQPATSCTYSLTKQ